MYESIQLHTSMHVLSTTDLLLLLEIL